MTDILEAVRTAEITVEHNKTRKSEAWFVASAFYQDQMAKALLALHAAQPVWRPISEYDRDKHGSSVWAYCPEDNWKFYMANQDGYGNWMQSNSGWSCSPTHFQVPAAPTEQQGGEPRE